MAFLAADAYDRFMGRFSEPLADHFVEVIGEVDAMVLDVGCGPGALTARLVDRFGAGSVAAVDPSAPFVEALRDRCPGVEVRQASAEALPFADDTFGATVAQLVVHFMTDPLAGVREMVRVTRPGGLVAANVWDHGGGKGPLSLFWRAVKEIDPAAPDESTMPGTWEGDLLALFTEAGLRDPVETLLTTTVAFPDVQTWWEPFTLGVGPAGDYVAGLDQAARDRLRDRCAALLPDPPFEVAASAWCATGRVGELDGQRHGG